MIDDSKKMILDYALAGVTSVEEVLKVCATLTDEVTV